VRAGAARADPRRLTAATVDAPVVSADEVSFSAIRAQGAGGQNVNKVSNSVHLRFDVAASSLPEPLRERLLASGDRRISADGVLVIKAQRHRSLEMNKQDALARLNELIAQAADVPPPRKPTRPTRASRKRRLEGKSQRGELKSTRAKVDPGRT
jgi:ribosome-associated protein